MVESKVIFKKKSLKKFVQNYDLVVLHHYGILNQKQYMNDLLDSKFVFIMITVSSDGLDDSWLGKTIGLSEILTLKNYLINLDLI